MGYFFTARNNSCGKMEYSHGLLFTARNNSCGKVMFSQVCVKNFVHKGGGHAWQGGCAWQERRPLQRTVRTLLECILVILVFRIYFH